MSFEVIGCASRQQYGEAFPSRAAAWRFINWEFAEQVQPCHGKALREHVHIVIPEPLVVINCELPIERQIPYLGRDERVREITARHKWERAHRVREVVG